MLPTCQLSSREEQQSAMPDPIIILHDYVSQVSIGNRFIRESLFTRDRQFIYLIRQNANTPRKRNEEGP